MNIISYVKKNKSDFAHSPFNEADSLVLCELSYLSFFDCLSDAPKVTLSQLGKHACELSRGTLLPRGNRRLLRAVSQSPRFGNVTVGYFSSENSAEREFRFAAVTFGTQAQTYVAFRGTDTTFLGWKEDFNLAVTKTIPSQLLAADYLNAVADKTQGQLIVGGHSKGGNLAVYAALNAPQEVACRIIDVFDHDGPGFFGNVFSGDMVSRIRKTVPQGSVIGMLLHTIPDFDVVYSKNISLLQHNPFSWRLNSDGTFKRLPRKTPFATAADIALNRWIYSLDASTRKALVDAIYTVVCGSGATTVPQLVHRPIRRFIGMKRAFNRLEEGSKQLLRDNKKLLKRLLRDARRQTRRQLG